MKARLLLIFFLLRGLGTSILANESDWEFNPYDFQYDMTVYVGLNVDGNDEADLEQYRIAAFCDNQCRGIVEVKEANGHKYGYLRIRSNVLENESIGFQIYNANTGKELKSESHVAFKAQDMIGFPSSPFMIEALSIKEIPVFEWSATSVVYDMNAPVALPILTNNSDGVVTFSSSNTEVAHIDENGGVSILAEGVTTIMAEVAASEIYSAASASYTLEVINTYVPGKGIAFVAYMDNEVGCGYAMSTHSSKSDVMDAVVVRFVNGKVINAANQAELSWYVDKSAGTIQTASGAYLTATADGTALSTATKKCVWTWDDAEGIFVQGTRSFFYSEGTGFKNYATSNKNNKGYSGLSQMMTFADGHVRTGLTAEDWGTICLPNAVAAGDVTGADFYPVAGKVVTDGKVTAIVLGEAVTTLEAGVPYVFSAKESSLLAAYSGEAVSAPVAANGLTGTLAAINADKNAEDTELSGKYMLVGNTWRLCGKGCSLAANRAYLDMDAVPSLAAGSYALTMSVFDDGATGIESVDATASAPVDVYTVSGVRVRASVSSAQATEGLQKGLYIINGKKVLVK